MAVTVEPVLCFCQRVRKAGGGEKGSLDRALRFGSRAGDHSCLTITENALGAEHPDLSEILPDYAAHLRKTKRRAEAKRHEKRANAILAKHSRDNFLDHTIDVGDVLAFKERERAEK